MIGFRILIVLLQTAFLASPSFAEDRKSKCLLVSDEWKWFDDYVVAKIDYELVAASGRKFEVGTGVFFRNSPLGSKIEIDGQGEVSGFGAGALHVRKHDNGEDFEVCMSVHGVKTISIFDLEF